MSNRRGRKRKLEKELDELVLQDSWATQKSEESASEPISLGNGGDAVTTESSSQKQCVPLLPDYPDDNSIKTKANGQGQPFCGVAMRSLANQLARFFYKIGHYSVIVSFPSSNFNFSNAGGRTLPLFHYAFVLYKTRNCFK